jgi:hypothetical protein
MIARLPIRKGEKSPYSDDPEKVGTNSFHNHLLADPCRLVSGDAGSPKEVCYQAHQE